jgi:hypothetical protein
MAARKHRTPLAIVPTPVARPPHIDSSLAWVEQRAICHAESDPLAQSRSGVSVYATVTTATESVDKTGLYVGVQLSVSRWTDHQEQCLYLDIPATGLRVLEAAIRKAIALAEEGGVLAAALAACESVDRDAAERITEHGGETA